MAAFLVRAGLTDRAFPPRGCDRFGGWSGNIGREGRATQRECAVTVILLTATLAVPLALATYAWLKTNQRIGTVDELVALSGSVGGWGIVVWLGFAL